MFNKIMKMKSEDDGRGIGDDDSMIGRCVHKCLELDQINIDLRMDDLSKQ